MDAAPPPSPTPGQLSWAHTDSRGIQAAVGAALTRAQSMQWAHDDASVADLRALVLDSFLVTAGVGATPPMTIQGTLTIRPNPNADRPDYRDWQTAIMRATLVLLAKDPRVSTTLTNDVRIDTIDGAPPSAPEAAFLLPAFLGAVAIVAVTGAIAAVVIDWLDQDNQIQAIQLATDANVQKHAATLAAANQIVEQHLARENAQHSSIPWDDQELGLLNDLKTSSTQLADWKATGVQPGPVGGAVASVGSGVSGAVKDVGTAVGRTATTAALGGEVLLAAVAAFWIWESERGKRAAA